MTDRDKPMFAAALTELAALKPGAKLTAMQFEAWWHAMRGRWTLKEFVSACERLVTECEFMPNPFHFEQLRKASRPTAGESFATALQLAGNCTIRELEDLSCSTDPRLDAAVRACGGWRVFAMAETEKLGFLERRFAEHFEAISDAEDTRAALPNLTGGPKLIDGPTRGLARLSLLTGGKS